MADFTSHYVPIKSNTVKEISSDTPNFTSHYVPIKSFIFV